MSKTATESPSDARKSKGKSKAKGVGQGKKGRKPISQVIAHEQSTSSADSGSAAHKPQRQMPIIREIVESDHGEDLAPKRKRGQLQSITEPASGTFSHAQAWNPELLLGIGPISVQDTILENTKIEILAKVTHGLSQAACLPKDMKVSDPMHFGQIFCYISRGLMIISLFARSIFLTLLVSNLSFFLLLGRLGCSHYGS